MSRIWDFDLNAHGAEGIFYDDTDGNRVSVADTLDNVPRKDRAATISATYTFSARQRFQDVVDFDEISEPSAPAAGQLRVFAGLDSGFGVLETKNSTGRVFRINEDTFRIVRNTSGATLNRGEMVYFAGSTGNKPNVKLAKADATTTMPAVAMVAVPFDDNTFGIVIVVGRVEDLNTSAFSEGDTLYVSPTTAGALTKTRPTHPDFAQSIGTVEVSHASNGAVLVSVTSFASGHESGTDQNEFAIGDGLAGTKDLAFVNDTGRSKVSWTPTAARTLTLPDVTAPLVAAATSTITANIPTDFSTLQDALDFYSTRHVKQGTRIILNIETGHALTAGLKCDDGNYGHVWITADDATVSLDAGFTGVSGSAHTGQSDTDVLFYCYNSTFPVLDCKIDMGNAHGIGLYVTSRSTAFVNSGGGVINAGLQGLSVRSSRVWANGTVWDGANDEGIRVENNSTVSVDSNSSADNCCASPTTSPDAAVFVSRGSILNAQNLSAQNSGKEGFRAQRSFAALQGANFSGAAEIGINSSHGSWVYAQGATASNCGTNGAIVRHSGYLILVGGVVKDNTGRDISLGTNGGLIWATGVETTDSGGSPTPHVNDISETYFNALSGSGTIYDEGTARAHALLGENETFTGNDYTFGDGVGLSQVKVDGADGSVADLVLMSGTLARWIFRKNADAESGSDAGSKLELRARADDGSDLGKVFTIPRDTRVLNFDETPTVLTNAIRHEGNYPSTPAPEDLTIATGAITLTSSRSPLFVHVSTEGGASTDDLDTISGGTPGQVIILVSKVNTDTVTVKDGTGNLFLNGNTDFALDGRRDTVSLAYHPTVDEWLEVGRSNNP